MPAAVRRHGRVGRRAERPGADGLDRARASTRSRRSRATPSGGSARCGSQSTTRSATSSARSTRPWSRAGFAAEWIERFEPPLEGRFTAALRHVPDGVLQPARWVRRLAGHAAAAGVEIREHTPRLVARRARRRHRRRLHRRLPERAARPDRGADHPDARPGDRDRADPGAPLRGAALRSPRVRLLAPGRGRADRRRRLPRRLLRHGVHRGRAADRARAGGAARLRQRAARARAAGRLRLGRASSAW